MEMIADILLVAGALGAAFYCFILGRRLNRFNDLEKGVGGAVAVLSSQVDDLTKTLTAAQRSAGHSAETLSDLSRRAEETSRRLELQMASLHDLQPVSSEAHPNNKCEETRPPQPSEPMFVRHRTSGTAS